MRAIATPNADIPPPSPFTSPRPDPHSTCKRLNASHRQSLCRRRSGGTGNRSPSQGIWASTWAQPKGATWAQAKGATRPQSRSPRSIPKSTEPIAFNAQP